ncbi:hypothetical protein B0T22DRAFT_462982 [Podospora appendiculata]|uniref:Clr5 domain-containing protein n=1 Tax=Podospora appendiculata TaxID=314037 RepID=A0AAE1CDU3_9PEZI|nr:hypothetical protein B0T22DRAFT_462982 [Podospora appendiculata]
MLAIEMDSDTLDEGTSPESLSPMSRFAENHVSGLIFDDDDDEDDDVLIKDGSSSPPSDGGRRLFLARRQPSRFGSGAGQLSSSATDLSSQRTAGVTVSQHKAGRAANLKSAGKSAASVSTTGSRAPHPSRTPLIPRKAEDWEPWKSILYELYITQNRILREIINLMDTTYNLKATPKMYKNQFARWNFFKYAIKRKPPKGKTGRSAKRTVEEDDGAPVAVHNHDDLILSPLLLHKSSQSRAMQAGLTAVRQFVNGYVDLDPVHLQEDVVFGYHDPCYRYFKTAMDLFDLKENVEGGRVLRLAFLQIEPKVLEPDLKSFSDLCFLIPHLLLESGRKDILSAYLQYLTRLATVKFGNHPFTEILTSFADLTDRPEEIMRYIMTLSKVNADTIAGLKNVLGRTQTWAQNQYLACQRSTDPATAVARVTHDHHMIRLEAQSVYWAQNLIMNDPESDDLASQWLHRNFDTDFAERCEGFLVTVKERVAAGTIPGEFAMMMECLYIGWLNDFYETQEDWENVFKWARRGLELSTNEQYIIWSIHVEGLMRKHGTVEEAEELRAKRLQHEWLESVRLQVDRLSLN